MWKNFEKSPVVYDELKARLTLNMGRLTAHMYRPSAIYTEDKAGWPADWEGRTILALCSHFKATGMEPAYLREIIEEIPAAFNEKGYMGKIYDVGIFNEQQLSGHNWLIRGLIEYFLITGDGKIMDLVKTIVENLYLPLAGSYASYPLDPKSRAKTGEAAGKVTGAIGSWLVSSDIGCAFMCLDGLSQYYELTKDSRVLALLDEMTDVFKTIDFVGNFIQTHATLSATRGIIRLYEVSGDKKYLEIAENVFEIYQKHGMTENYANFNWFGRYDTWTEPCAIVDSLMVAFGLFRATEENKYLTIAQRIYYNAICYAQRANGGFGLDKTVGPKEKYLRPSGEGFSEAFWCCTMRGAEGLRAMTDNLFLKKDNTVYITFMLPACLETDEYRLEVCSKLPVSGKFNMRITFKERMHLTVKIFDGSYYTFDAFEGDVKKVSGEIILNEYEEEGIYIAGKKHFRGNMILAKNRNEEVLRPLNDIIDIDEKKINDESREIVL